MMLLAGNKELPPISMTDFELPQFWLLSFLSLEGEPNKTEF